MVDIKLTYTNEYFFYIPTAKTDKEIVDIHLVTISSKKMKYLRIKLTKEVKDIYNEIFNPFNKEIKNHKKVEGNSIVMNW